MNELVRLSTQDVSRAVPVTDSFIVSEKFGVSHKAVTNIIRKYKQDFEVFGKLEHFKNAYETKKETILEYTDSFLEFSLTKSYPTYLAVKDSFLSDFL